MIIYNRALIINNKNPIINSRDGIVIIYNNKNTGIINNQYLNYEYLEFGLVYLKQKRGDIGKKGAKFDTLFNWL
jgi:hypothetical protein